MVPSTLLLMLRALMIQMPMGQIRENSNGTVSLKLFQRFLAQTKISYTFCI
jgi:hypothetical protein